MADLSLPDWLNHLQQELMDAAIYCERLKAELGRLQKTSLALPDGTLIAPGTEVFFWTYNEPKRLLRHAIDFIEWYPGGVWLTFATGTIVRSIKECYGTEQAAQAAGGGG